MGAQLRRQRLLPAVPWLHRDRAHREPPVRAAEQPCGGDAHDLAVTVGDRADHPAEVRLSHPVARFDLQHEIDSNHVVLPGRGNRPNG
jgi:hypothetical protein